MPSSSTAPRPRAPPRTGPMWTGPFCSRAGDLCRVRRAWLAMLAPTPQSGPLRGVGAALHRRLVPGLCLWFGALHCRLVPGSRLCTAHKIMLSYHKTHRKVKPGKRLQQQRLGWWRRRDVAAEMRYTGDSKRALAAAARGSARASGSNAVTSSFTSATSARSSLRPAAPGRSSSPAASHPAARAEAVALAEQVTSAPRTSPRRLLLAMSRCRSELRYLQNEVCICSYTYARAHTLVHIRTCTCARRPACCSVVKTIRTAAGGEWHHSRPSLKLIFSVCVAAVDAACAEEHGRLRVVYGRGAPPAPVAPARSACGRCRNAAQSAAAAATARGETAA